TTLARVVEPYFQRSWRQFSSHQQTPGSKLTSFAAAVQGGKGQGGRVAYISYPIFSAFATHGNFPYRLLVRNGIERLLPDPIVRRRRCTPRRRGRRLRLNISPAE